MRLQCLDWAHLQSCPYTLLPVFQFLCTLRRSVAPHTPRVVLLGPSGSGKSLQAASLARNYRLVDGEKMINSVLSKKLNSTDSAPPPSPPPPPLPTHTLVDCRQLIRQTLVSGSKLAHQMKPFREGNMLSKLNVHYPHSPRARHWDQG